MTLIEYRKKRNLKNSSEPLPKIEKQKSQGLVFVIQKHHATHLHYDFRLELGGVLKSWAVPKGPSLNPKDKRLGIMVEDHPFDYRNFEGIIPKGNYGAGTVMIWDSGIYTHPQAKSKKEAEKLIAEGLRKGHLEIVMNGKKLKGLYTLVKMPSAGDNGWLLIKGKDEYASTKDIAVEDRSSETDRTMDQIAEGMQEGASAEWKSILEKAPKGSMPAHITPMMGTLVEEPFDRKEWLFEVKWDGYRAVASIEKNKISLLSRNQNSFNELFSALIPELQKLSLRQAILDGEVVIVDSSGRSDFQLMQNYQRTQQGQLVYYVFDLLYLDGHDLRSLPLIQRKTILKELLKTTPESRVRYSDHIEEKGKAFFKKAVEKHLEGIMAKDATSPYLMKRSRYWLKVKGHLRQEAVIGGFTQPRGSRKKIGALLLGVYEKGKLVYIGHAGGGFTQASLADVHAQLEPLIQDKCPFSSTPKANEQVTWVKPQLVCEVSFAEWTSEGLMRQPIFKGMRVDKLPKQVKREKPS